MRQRKSSLLSVMSSCRMALLLVSERVLNRASFRFFGVGVGRGRSAENGAQVFDIYSLGCTAWARWSV